MTNHDDRNMSSRTTYRHLPRITYTLQLIILSASILLHTIGLFSIYLHTKKTNQNLLLGSLSICEILMALRNLLQALIQDVWLAMNTGSVDVWLTMYQVLVYVLLLMMWVITVDRLICALNPLMYLVRMTRGRIALTLAVIWMVSIVLGTARGLVMSEVYDDVHQIAAFAIALVYIPFVFFTYVYILWKIQRSRSYFRRDCPTSSKNNNNNNNNDDDDNNNNNNNNDNDNNINKNKPKGC